MKFSYRNPNILYRGKRVDLLSIEAQLANGAIVKKEVVDHPGAVVILPFLNSEQILLIRNVRPAVQQTLLELPAGTLEIGEEPISCARRELEEETGYRAEKITPFLNLYSTPGFCNEILYFFVAKNLHLTAQRLDPSEEIQVEPIAFPLALEKIQAGEICDAKTVAALLFYNSFLK